jgi:phosphatidate cytidylyltransferase
MSVSSLYKRIATALALIPPVVWGVLTLPTGTLALLMGAVVALGAWEWAALMGFSAAIARAGYVILVGMAMLATWGSLTDSATLVFSLLVCAVVAWALGLFVVWRYPVLPLWWRGRPVQAVAGLLVLVPAWAALVALHGGWLPQVSGGPRYALFLLALVWVADTAAFFAGRRWGSHRLAPRVSPGKTWEGLWGAGIATVVIAALGAWWLGLGAQRWGIFVGLCVATLLSSVLGDLLESVVKRSQGVKDSGMLLPGHGGVLDRIDSLTAASPVFVLGLVLLWRLTA